MSQGRGRSRAPHFRVARAPNSSFLKMPAIALIDAVPPFVSQEEYNSLIASTPSSFNDLPFVLKHKEEDVSVKIDPALEGFSEEDAAKGTLYVLTRHVHSSHTAR